MIVLHAEVLRFLDGLADVVRRPYGDPITGDQFQRAREIVRDLREHGFDAEIDRPGDRPYACVKLRCEEPFEAHMPVVGLVDGKRFKPMREQYADEGKLYEFAFRFNKHYCE